MYIITASTEEFYTIYENTYKIEAINIKEALDQIKGLKKVSFIYYEPTIEVKKDSIDKKDKLNNYNNSPINTETKEIDKIRKVLKENNIKFFAGATLETLRQKLIDNNLHI